jgi:hypothetical protein
VKQRNLQRNQNNLHPLDYESKIVHNSIASAVATQKGYAQIGLQIITLHRRLAAD